MEPSYIEELRLTAFKSFKDATLPMGELALLVGRNGSGKSNALDGLWALARLAEGEDVRDALDGGRDGPAVRGGAAGCAPFGESSFSLGCRVRTGKVVVDLEVTVQTEPMVQILKERLLVDGKELLGTEPPQHDSSDITASWANLVKGRNPHVGFRASRLLTTQVLARIPATAAGQKLHLAAAQVLAALRAVFVLDPVPHQMRQYVPRRDLQLRRNADNLSAAVASLIESAPTGDTLRTALGQLNEHQVEDVRISTSELDDVMLTLQERFGEHSYPVPARVMSDGTLRFLAILVALLQAPTRDTMPEPLASEDALGQTTVVIEELENGLHASQASMLLGLIREQVGRRRVRVLASAHSPAVLDAIRGDEHHDIIVCQRDAAGRSTLARLTDLPNYLGVV
ncbi:MAG: AAA family ATPase, partial [Actinomycetota bacterium]|nr:AAA family ATPase [Actinomycetota bacterium]